MELDHAFDEIENNNNFYTNNFEAGDLSFADDSNSDLYMSDPEDHDYQHAMIKDHAPSVDPRHLHQSSHHASEESTFGTTMQDLTMKVNAQQPADIHTSIPIESLLPPDTIMNQPHQKSTPNPNANQRNPRAMSSRANDGKLGPVTKKRERAAPRNTNRHRSKTLAVELPNQTTNESAHNAKTNVNVDLTTPNPTQPNAVSYQALVIVDTPISIAQSITNTLNHQLPPRQESIRRTYTDMNQSQDVLEASLRQKPTQPMQQVHSSSETSLAKLASQVAMTSSIISPTHFYIIILSMYKTSMRATQDRMPWHLPMVTLVEDMRKMVHDAERSIDQLTKSAAGQVMDDTWSSMYRSLSMPDMQDQQKLLSNANFRSRFECDGSSINHDMYLYAIDGVCTMMINLNMDEDNMYAPAVTSKFTPCYTERQLMTCAFNADLSMHQILSLMIELQHMIKVSYGSNLNWIDKSDFIYMVHPVVQQLGLLLPKNLYREHCKYIKDPRVPLIRRDFYVYTL